MHTLNLPPETLHQIWRQLHSDSRQRLSNRLFFLALRLCQRCGQRMDLREMRVESPVLRERVWSLMGVPRSVERRVVGVIQVGTFGSGRFTEDELVLLLLIADPAACTIGRALRRDEAERAEPS